MTDHSIFFQVALFPEEIVAKDDILFDNYLCDDNQSETVLNYLNNFYYTPYYQSKGIKTIDKYGKIFNVNIKIESDNDWTTADWLNQNKLKAKAYEVLVPNQEMKITINDIVYEVKIKINKCLFYVNTCCNDDGDY